MMRIADLPRAIRNAISDWRLWTTLSLTAALIINEAVIGIREGQPLAESLTRMPFHRTLYLMLIASIISQAGIGTVPIITGFVMTLYDWALQRRLNWKAEGRQEGHQAGHAEGRQEGHAEGRREGQAEGRQMGHAEGLREGREEILRESIARVLADNTLTPDQKNHFIAILNAR